MGLFRQRVVAHTFSAQPGRRPRKCQARADVVGKVPLSQRGGLVREVPLPARRGLSPKNLSHETSSNSLRLTVRCCFLWDQCTRISNPHYQTLGSPGIVEILRAIGDGLSSARERLFDFVTRCVLTRGHWAALQLRVWACMKEEDEIGLNEVGV